MGAEFWINRAQAAMKEMDAFNGASFMERTADTLLRASLANRQAMNARALFHLNFLGDLADQAKRGFDSLKGRTRRAFERAGIDAADWDHIRTAVESGHVHPEALLATGERGKIDAAIKLLGLSAREQDFAQVQGDVRTQILKNWNSQAGTPGGFAAREAMRFKSYAVGIVETHINRMIFETRGFGEKLGYSLGFGVGLTIMGAVAQAMKDIIAGKDPRDMTDWKNWASAAAQGGGLGIFGDLIKSGVTRADSGFWDTLLGPSAVLVKDAANIALANIRQASEGKDTNIGREAARFLRAHTPGASMWYTRRAVDGYLWDYLHMQLDPKYPEYFSRMEKKARKELNQEYWWRPGGLGPDRAPDLGAIRGR
jgi:hypothetical protein